jgi:branched-chain amino acid transport system ATP-binding protein
LLDMRRRDNVTLLINEQSSERVMRVADRVYVLRNGVIRLCIRPADIADGRSLKSAYFGFDEPQETLQKGAQQ